MTRWKLGLVWGLALAAPPAVAAQQPQRPPVPATAAPKPARPQRCQLQIDNVDRQGIAVETPQGTNYFAGGNVRLRCRGTQITMSTDSVASFAGNVIEFIGRVRYRDSTLTMDADRGTYYRSSEQWEARGNVRTKNLKTGSTLVGPSLDYFRVVEGVRDTSEMYAVSRPTIHYFTRDTAQADSARAPVAGAPADSADSARGEPYVIVADRVRIKGDDRIWAGGKVTIDRSDLAARGDSLRLDTGPANDGTLLGKRPEIHGIGADSFDLEGRRIDFKLKGREISFVMAKGDGKAVNKEWTLVADTIAIDVNQRKVERTLAWGDSLRPVATSPKYEIRADSLALDTPEQQIREARAFGKAWLGGQVDSATKERDWLAGDTVLATFAPHDSAGTARTALSRLTARDAARSYRLERDSSAKADARPSISYALADEIVVTMKPDGSERAELVELRGHVSGAQLEPSKGAPPAQPAAPGGPPGAPSTPKDSAVVTAPGTNLPAAKAAGTKAADSVAPAPAPPERPRP